MATELNGRELNDGELADALNHPEGERYQRAKIELADRQIKAQREAIEAQREAIEAQRQAAKAELLAAEASLASAKVAARAAVAGERNGNYMLGSVVVAAISAFFAAASAIASYLSAVHPR